VLDYPNQEQPDTNNNAPKNILPPPICIKGILVFIRLRNDFIKIIGPDSFLCKLTTTYLKIQKDTTDNYRILRYWCPVITRYQLQSHKLLRVVIRNVFSSTPETHIASALEELGHTLKNVTNVKHQLIRTPLPLFFVDIDPKVYDNSIFDNTSLLTRILKLRNSIKDDRFQNFRSIYPMAKPVLTAYTNQNVSNVGATTIISPVKKSSDLPAKWTLCEQPHPVNYKGCQIYKHLTHKHNFSPKKL